MPGLKLIHISKRGPWSLCWGLYISVFFPNLASCVYTYYAWPQLAFITTSVPFSRAATQWNDYVIKWKHFPRYWLFVRGIHLSPVISPHKDRWRGTLMFPLFCAWTNRWVNNRDAGDLRRHRAHYDVILMKHHYPKQACYSMLILKTHKLNICFCTFCKYWLLMNTELWTTAKM